MPPRRCQLPGSETTSAQPPTHSVTPPHALKEHFGDLDQQRETASLGMWIFLATEIMFFAGLFTAYLIYRISYPVAFMQGSQYMNFWAGTINTVVLICSSLAVALAIRAVKLGRNKNAVLLLSVAMLLGTTFLVIHGYEYRADYLENHIPGSYLFGINPHTGLQVFSDPRHTELFFLLMFVMTALHGLHVLIGVSMMAYVAVKTWHGKYTPLQHNALENVGLYWHFVDMVWIYLYPLLYLIAHKSLKG
jgi:cytochrome c oxidase subunit III